MSSRLLDKLKKTQKEVEKSLKKNLNPNSSLCTLTDSEIALVLDYRAKNLRVSQQIKQKDFSKTAHLSSTSTYANFEQKGTVSLINFIKIIRNLGRLYELEEILKPTISEKIDGFEDDLRRRVR